MPVTIDEAAPVQFITNDYGQPDYPRQVVVDLGRPGLRYGIEMRDLILWTAYRLDTGSNGEVNNHRAAGTLRHIAEALYPHIDDEADDMANELGIELDLADVRLQPLRFDIRLLGLVDDMVFVGTSFAEMLWNDQNRHPMLAANAANTLDFEFPPAAFEVTGIRGIRVAVNDLINWLLAGESSEELAFLNVESAVDELEIVQMRALAAAKRYSAARRRELIDTVRSREPLGESPAPDVAEQDQILDELSALI